MFPLERPITRYASEPPECRCVVLDETLRATAFVLDRHER